MVAARSKGQCGLPDPRTARHYADRTAGVDVNRGDPRGFQEMVRKKFVSGWHCRSKADLDINRQPRRQP
jgi:hypothetical protein